MSLARQQFIDEWAPKFPLRTFSVGSMNAYRRCPEKWRRTYLLGEHEPPSGKMVAGNAAGAAALGSFQNKLDTGKRFTREQVLDVFSDEFEERSERESPDWGDDVPGVLKDSGAAALSLYHGAIAPAIRPLAVERPFKLRIDSLPWALKGYIDLERLPKHRRKHRAVASDLKLTQRRMSEPEAAQNNQATYYLAARRAERDPAPHFEFHVMLRQSQPGAYVLTTRRNDAQLDQALSDAVWLAAEIAWRTELDAWIGAPPNAWWCSPTSCGFYRSCPFGGQHASQGDRGLA